MRKKINAISMFSGGLDSMLATLVIKNQGIDVIAVNFHTGFEIADHKRILLGASKAGPTFQAHVRRSAERIGVALQIIDIDDEYLSIITNPKFGRGSQINPCIDCRIMMLKNARKYMHEIGAQFIITGEVVGQRPMTQHRPTLRMIEKQSNLKGLIVRPLCAKLLAPSIPEKEGWVDRNLLFDFYGRGRKNQMWLARELGIEQYPQPAGGSCYPTDPGYARKFNDLLELKKGQPLTREDLILLKVGRHFNLPGDIKLIVGRNENENNFLETFRSGRWAFEATDYAGPLSLAFGELDQKSLELAAQITATYCDGKDEAVVTITCQKDDEIKVLNIPPLDRSISVQWLI